MARRPTPVTLPPPRSVLQTLEQSADAAHAVAAIAALKHILENRIAALEILQALAAGEIDSASELPILH